MVQGSVCCQVKSPLFLSLNIVCLCFFCLWLQSSPMVSQYPWFDDQACERFSFCWNWEKWCCCEVSLSPQISLHMLILLLSLQSLVWQSSCLIVRFWFCCNWENGKLQGVVVKFSARGSISYICDAQWSVVFGLWFILLPLYGTKQTIWTWGSNSHWVSCCNQSSNMQLQSFIWHSVGDVFLIVDSVGSLWTVVHING